MSAKSKNSILLVNRFSWHRESGDFAERHFRQNYFSGIGLSFRKIRKDRKGQKPDGYVLEKSKNRIAVVEIKLIQYNKKYNTKAGGKLQLQRITTDATTRAAIRKAKKQLQCVATDLPKIVYLIRDDSFLKSYILRAAIFGNWKTVMRGDEVIFNGHSGFDKKTKEDNKMRDRILSAIICFVPLLNGYKLWVYRNKLAKPIPKKFLDRTHIEELWDYDVSSLKKII